MPKMHAKAAPSIGVVFRYLVLLLAIATQDRCHAIDSASATNPNGALKDDCSLNDKLIVVNGEQSDKSSDELCDKITTIFEGEGNYSLKSFAADSIIEYKTLEQNETQLAAAQLATNITLKNTDEADDIEEDEKEYIHNIGQRFLSLIQPFDTSRNPESSTECRQHTQRYLEGLQNFELWALKMYDSTGKLNSGILNGNIIQFGDFNQCLGVSFKTGSIFNDHEDENILRGQYCLVYAQPHLPHKSKRLKQFFKLIQAHGIIKSEFNDPGHRIPRFSLINWGICVPAACSPQDVEYTVKEYLSNMTAKTGISFQVRVEPKMCQTRNNKPWDRNTTWAVLFFVVILSIAILSTIYDLLTETQKKNKWCTAFSLYKNVIWLFTTDSSSNDIEAVHGIRFLNAIMLLLSHKTMATYFDPFNNRTEMSESVGRPWTFIVRAASLYTDPFLLFSGMLTAYSLFGRLFKGQPIRLRNEYISRLMRIVPPLAALILFCTFILPMWGSGPQWNLVVGHQADICKRNWWRNLLFIHNYFSFDEMCLTHTHHLGIDTELFAVAPIMILALWKWPKKGLYVLIFLGLLGTGARYYTTIVYQLSNYLYFGTSVQRLFRTATNMYSFPPYRSTVYIMGILLGYGLRKFQGKRLSRPQLYWGWFVSIICVLASLLGPAPMGNINYEYNSTHAAIYAAFAPITWCIFFSWIVFVSHNGYTNQLTDLLSWHGFQVSTKLSYALYLTQAPVFFVNVGRRRHIRHYYNVISVGDDFLEFAAIFIASIVLTLLFDAPFQNIKKILIKRSPASVVSAKMPLENGLNEAVANCDASQNNIISAMDSNSTINSSTMTTHLHAD